MKKYVIALAALSGLGSINSAEGFQVGPPPGTVKLANSLKDLAGNPLPVFFSINGNTQQNIFIAPLSSLNYKGVVTSIIAHTPPIYAFPYPPQTPAAQRFKVNTIYWDWNKYRSQIEKQKAAFLKAYPNFPNDVASITFGRSPAPDSTVVFYFTGKNGSYINEPFPINCGTGGGSFMIGQCPGG